MERAQHSLNVTYILRIWTIFAMTSIIHVKKIRLALNAKLLNLVPHVQRRMLQPLNAHLAVMDFVFSLVIQRNVYYTPVVIRLILSQCVWEMAHVSLRMLNAKQRPVMTLKPKQTAFLFLNLISIDWLFVNGRTGNVKKET